MKSSHRSILTSLLLACATPNLFAASQGELGDVSVGSMNIRFVLPKIVVIKHLQDLALDTSNPESTVIGISPMCLWSSTHSVSLTARQQGHNEFMLVSNNDELPYSVVLVQHGKEGRLEPNQPMGGISASAKVDCNDGSSNQLRIMVAEKDIQSATVGEYKATLELVAAPE